MYSGHVYFEPVRPQILNDVLNYLQLNNVLYRNTVINMDRLPLELIHFDENAQQITVTNEVSESTVECPEEEDENPLGQFRIAADETVMTSKIPHALDDDTLVVAPGEGRSPLSIINDEKCEELAHPHLFPTGNFGYNVERNIKLSPIKYFNQRLLNYSQKFASDSDYIFYAHHVVQQINLKSKINIAMKKMCGNNLTAGMLSSNFKETVKSFIANDEAFNFMNSIKGTPAYWKKLN